MSVAQFSVGERVIIRWGRQQGQKATIIKNQPVDAYKVKTEDGSIGYFSAKGLEKQKEPVGAGSVSDGQQRAV